MNTSMNFSKLSVVAGVLLGAVATSFPLTAQDPAVVQSGPGRVGDATSIVRAAHGLADDGERLVGGAHDYKVELDASGMTYTPALGAKASRNFPVHLSLSSIERGGAVVHAAQPGIRPTRHGNSAHFQRGAGIVERYEVRVDGVEQSFVFSERPAGQGDLVVRCSLETELTTSFRGEAVDGFSMHAAGLGGVSIGGVTAIDANGVQTRGTLRFDGATLELVLPGQVVDRAAYPLVLDPLVGTSFLVGASGNDDADPDVAYESTNDEYLVVWTRTFSGTNIEVRGQRVDGNGALVGSFIVITNDSSVSTNPSVGCVATTDRFLVAWQESASPFGPWDILCRAIDAGTGTLSAEVAVAATFANEVDPDVGGERQADDEAIVVWDDDSVGILATQVTVAASGADPSPFGQTTIRAAVGSQVSRPVISKSGGSTGRLVILYDAEFATPAIIGQAVTRNLGLIDSQIDIAIDVSLAERSADIDGNGSVFMAVWGETESGLSGPSDVYCSRITVTSTTASFSRKTLVSGDAGRDEVDPAIAYCGPKFVCVWSESRAAFLDYDVRSLSLDPGSCEACGVEQSIAGTRVRESTPEIASEYSGGSGSDDAMIAFASAATSGTFFSDVAAQRFSALGSGGSRSNRGGGCGSGGSYAISGTIAPGATINFGLTGSPGAAAILNFATVGGATLPCGSCTILLPEFSTPSIPIVAGSANLRLRLACDLSILGFGLDSQWLVLGATTPCSLTPTLQFSNITRFTVQL